MMQPMFRAVLIIVSVITMAYMLRKIRQSKLQIEDTMFWVFFSAVLVVFSLFPQAADACARAIGVYSTANFLFVSVIFLLLVKLFGMTLHLSQLESRQKELVQKMALEQKEKEELVKRVTSLLDEADQQRKEEESPKR